MSDRNQAFRLLSSAVVFIGMMLLLLPASAAEPTTRPSGGGVRSAMRKAERVTIETDDKTPVTIVGAYTPPPPEAKASRRPAVVLLHMYGEDHTAFDPLVPALHEAGFAVLAIDLRGHGQSVEPASLKMRDKVESRDPRLFRDMVKDVEAGCRWLARRNEVDPARWTIVGASVGASVALEYAGRDRSVDGLVLLTPGLDYLGIDSRASAPKYKARPLLMLAAEEERAAADELARTIPEAKVKIVGPRPAGEASMALHGTRMLGKVPGVEKEIVDFLIKAAGPSPDKPVVASILGQVFYDPASTQAQRLSPNNLRTFSSDAEAQSRGYRAPKRSSRK